jgi:hypothetical protein
MLEGLTTKHENIFSHNEEIVPFVVSLSNHERYRYDHSPFDMLRANGKKSIFKVMIDYDAETGFETRPYKVS